MNVHIPLQLNLQTLNFGLDETLLALRDSVAAFCAKEAFSKSLGTGISGFSLKEVSLLHNERGKPYLSFSGNAEKIVHKTGCSFDVSITHTESLATAVVISF